MPGGMQIRVDARELSALNAAAKAAPGKIQIELRRGVKKAAEPVKQGVQAAAAFSSRIPGAVKTKVSFAAKGASVVIYVDPAAAPEAAAINNKGRSGTFRHPVYGNRDNWVQQHAVPFMNIGATTGKPAAEAAMLKVMDAIAAQLGFK